LKRSKSGKRDFSAAESLIKDGRLSMRAIGRRCGIPERTLRRHAAGIPPHEEGAIKSRGRPRATGMGVSLAKRPEKSIRR
jgi:hypothetical protein